MELQNAVLHFKLAPAALRGEWWVRAADYVRVRSGPPLPTAPELAVPFLRGPARERLEWMRLGRGRNFYVLSIPLEEEDRRDRDQRRRGKRARSSRGSSSELVYTVFPRAGSVVVTGCRELYDDDHLHHGDDERPLPLRLFAEKLDLDPALLYGVRVVNSTWSGRIPEADRLGPIMRILRRCWDVVELADPLVTISFRTQFFPSARVQFGLMRGVINVFNNGNLVIVGVKGRRDMTRLLARFAALIDEYSTSPDGAPRCAWSAG